MAGFGCGESIWKLQAEEIVSLADNTNMINYNLHVLVERRILAVLEDTHADLVYYLV